MSPWRQPLVQELVVHPGVIELANHSGLATNSTVNDLNSDHVFLMAVKRKRDTGDVKKEDDVSPVGNMWCALRMAQRECGCNTRTLKTLYDAAKPFCKFKSTSSTSDGKLCTDANAVVLQLHGCVHCNDFVFSPDDNMLRCPKCDHPRFNQQKKPNEVSWFVLFI